MELYYPPAHKPQPKLMRAVILLRTLSISYSLLLKLHDQVVLARRCQPAACAV